jgi:enoyl-CoA hydratase
MAYTTLLIDQDADGIVVATINRPDKLNALNDAVISDLAALAAWAASEISVRAMIVTGAGEKAFVAGADIAEIAQTDATTGERLSRKGHAAFRELEQLGKPVIAAVNGFALGGGCELAMACQIRYASPNAKFGQPEVKLGLIPGYGGTVRLPRLVGRGRALELLLSGGMIDAAEAHRIGLVNKVVPLESLLAEAKALANVMLQMGPMAVRMVLETVDAALDLPLDAALGHEATQFGVACGSEEKREGTTAFLEKRPAQFRGR